MDFKWKHIAKGVWINVGGFASISKRKGIGGHGNVGRLQGNVRVSIDSNATVANIGDMGTNRTGLAMGIQIPHHHHHFVTAAFS